MNQTQHQKISGYGLNILSPLWPNGVKTGAQQAKFFIDLLSTPDPQILYYAKEVRPKRKSRERRQEQDNREASFRMWDFDYHEAFKKIIKRGFKRQQFV